MLRFGIFWPDKNLSHFFLGFFRSLSLIWIRFVLLVYLDSSWMACTFFISIMRLPIPMKWFYQWRFSSVSSTKRAANHQQIRIISFVWFIEIKRLYIFSLVSYRLHHIRVRGNFMPKFTYARHIMSLLELRESIFDRIGRRAHGIPIKWNVAGLAFAICTFLMKLDAWMSSAGFKRKRL